jgi:hypothetical protein
MPNAHQHALLSCLILSVLLTMPNFGVLYTPVFVYNPVWSWVIPSVLLVLYHHACPFGPVQYIPGELTPQHYS